MELVNSIYSGYNVEYEEVQITGMQYTMVWPLDVSTNCAITGPSLPRTLTVLNYITIRESSSAIVSKTSLNFATQPQ